MNRRTRFQATMRHQPVDRPPIDIGATSLTAMAGETQARLRQALGFSPEERPGNSGVDERILEWAGTDFRAVGAIIELPSKTVRQISEAEFVDCWGVRRRLVGGYWDVVEPPLRGATPADLDDYPWPEPRVDERALERWTAEARRLRGEGEYVVIGEHPVFGILELGCWMCGYDDFLLRLVADPDFIRKFFDRVLALQLAVIDQYYGALGPYLDLTMSGDDFGMQSRPLLSPELFEALIAPYFTERIRRTKAHGNFYYWHHTCGSVLRLLDLIIRCGVDILNPVQTSAAEMDPARLKAGFGDRLVFWGGVDVQDFLTHATPDQVRAGVRECVRILGRDGGYVIAPAHNMQRDIPVENIIAWVETLRALS